MDQGRIIANWSFLVLPCYPTRRSPSIQSWRALSMSCYLICVPVLAVVLREPLVKDLHAVELKCLHTPYLTVRQMASRYVLTRWSISENHSGFSITRLMAAEVVCVHLMDLGIRRSLYMILYRHLPNVGALVFFTLICPHIILSSLNPVIMGRCGFGVKLFKI